MDKHTFGDENEYPALRSIREILEEGSNRQWQRNIIRRIVNYTVHIDKFHEHFKVTEGTVDMFINHISYYRNDKVKEILESQYPQVLRDHIACFYHGYARSLIRKYQRKYNKTTWN